MIHLFKQGSDEWHEYRRFKFTASQAQAIFTHNKGLISLIDKMFEENTYFDNEAMSRGRGLESYAASLFELKNNITLLNVGFVDYTNFSGCSPDGLIMDGDTIISGIEIKCRNLQKHDVYLRHIMDKPTFYQIQFCMMVCGVNYWYFVAYNPDHLIEYHQEIIERDEDIINEIRYGLEIGENLLKSKII